MKTKQELEVEFKQAKFVCGCGYQNEVVVLMVNGYGFTDAVCESCKKRYKVEVDDNFTYAKSI